MTDPRNEGHRLLLGLYEHRPARLLARKVNAPVRTVRDWLAGSVPLWRYRERLAAELGIGLTSWFEPAKEAPRGSD